MLKIMLAYCINAYLTQNQHHADETLQVETGRIAVFSLINPQRMKLSKRARRYHAWFVVGAL